MTRTDRFRIVLGLVVAMFVISSLARWSLGAVIFGVLMAGLVLGAIVGWIVTGARSPDG